MATTDHIASKILTLRSEKVLLDFDIALLYNVETKRLKESVRRNISRFPEDFMFQLTLEEWLSLRSQFASLKGLGRGKHPKYPPYAFTEQDVAMLSGVLKSQRAIETNIAIMRTFVELRKWMQSNKALAEKIHLLEKKYDQRFKLVFDAIQQLIRQEKEAHPIGFQIGVTKRK
jgi:hypothetical protein